jgi:polysaccharide deacetylase family protein (PEP-CTERM system associated)
MTAGQPTPAVVNAMTVDVEDYFQVSAFESRVPFSTWPTYESRVCRNTQRLLAVFAEAGVHATFFVLGWTAERYPGLIRAIADAGHELGSHSYAHRLVYELTPAAFREDLRRARAAIEWASSQPVLGFRAPSFSITRRSLWALDVLAEEGYAYDSSIFPICRDRYGVPGAPRHLHRVAGSPLWEMPPSTISCRGLNVPVAGGGYFRLFPYALTRRAIEHLNGEERQPAVVYLHPWELDPAQPRIAAGPLSTFRHYVNLTQTEQRVRRLIDQFAFGPMSAAIAAHSAGFTLPARRPVCGRSAVPLFVPGATAC